MKTAQELLAGAQAHGSLYFEESPVARDHSAVISRVRRDRLVRASVLSIAGVAAVGAAALGVNEFAGTTTQPAVTPPSPSATPSVVSESFTVDVGMNDSFDMLAARLATQFGVSKDVVSAAFVEALPPEADGNPEGWLLAGSHLVTGDDNDATSLDNVANQLVDYTTFRLDELGVPREEWGRTVVLASLLQWEAPAGQADQSAVARVLLNRLDANVRLELDSPVLYAAMLDPDFAGDPRLMDSPYNTFVHEGLPPSAIGSFTPEALEAAANPADGDWRWFLRDETGNVTLYTDVEEFSNAVEARSD